MMENREYLNNLFDIYKDLLTTIEQETFMDYYEEDLSLTEIAENRHISKASVSKTLKQVTTKLIDYETKLKIFENNSLKNTEDISFKLPNITFNYRVGCLIKKDAYILLEENTDNNYYSFIGGRVKLGETSEDAIIREFFEETGLETSIVKCLGLVENFFTSRYTNGSCHEILILYELKFNHQEDYEKDSIINKEASKTSKFKWILTENITEYNFKPSILANYLNHKEIFHLINKDK